jgi:hypothetical protein
VGVYLLGARRTPGTSAPTPERSVNVGNCGACHARLLHRDLERHVREPAGRRRPSGVVQGYQVAGSAPGAANLRCCLSRHRDLAWRAVAYGTYYVRVHATSVCGLSPPSNEVCWWCSVRAPPTAPVGLVGSQSGGVVTLAWTAPSGISPTSYTIVAGSTPGASDILVIRRARRPPALRRLRPAARITCGSSPPMHAARRSSNEVTVVVP